MRKASDKASFRATPLQDGFKRFSRNKAALISLMVLVTICGACLCAPLLTTFGYAEISLLEKAALPSLRHLLGADELGRDLFSRMLYGGRVTMRISFGSLLIAAGTGTVIGLISGFFGGKVDMLIMRLAEALAAVPTVLLAVVIECAFGWGEGNYMYAMALAFTPPFIRLLRTSVLNIMGSEYIEAARALGVDSFTIIRRHVLRNVAAPMLIHLSGTAAEAFLMCTVLGYVGLGVSPPTPEWGSMVSLGYSSLRATPHIGLIPCIGIVVCVLALNLLGNGLRDALDPQDQEG